MRLGNGREHFSSLVTSQRICRRALLVASAPLLPLACARSIMRNSSQFGVKSICANLGGSQGFAQVRLAFSVFIALGRAPTRGVRNDEVIILRAPRQMCVQCSGCTVQCSALSCGSGSAPLRKSVANRLSRLSRWTQVFRCCAWVWRAWISRVSGPARRAYMSALVVTNLLRDRC